MARTITRRRPAAPPGAGCADRHPPAFATAARGTVQPQPCMTSRLVWEIEVHLSTMLGVNPWRAANDSDQQPDAMGVFCRISGQMPRPPLPTHHRTASHPFGAIRCKPPRGAHRTAARRSVPADRSRRNRAHRARAGQGSGCSSASTRRRRVCGIVSLKNPGPRARTGSAHRLGADVQACRPAARGRAADPSPAP